MKKNFFFILFFISVAGVFSGIFLHLKWLDYFFKPLIMISLSGHFLIHSKNIDKKLVKLALFAFLFSMMGDSFLMFTGKGMQFFILGLSSFLAAQVFYILLFRQTVRTSGGVSFLKNNLNYLAGYIVYGTIVYSLLFNQLDITLKISVFVYMMALMGMSVMALNRFNVVKSYSFWLVFIGSVLFVISDSLIAIDKFLTAIPNDRFWVMSTYIAAQYLIMKGILKQFE